MEDSLSIKDRLILANQFDILAKLSKEEHEKEEYENLKEIFVSGYTRYYSLATEWFTDEVTNEECKFVVDVLDLYRDLYFSWLRNDEAQLNIDESKVLFKGFDLNDSLEVKYLSFYEFLVEKLNRYQEIKELMEQGKIESFNSHGFGPSMDELRKMVCVYRSIQAVPEYRYGNDLTFEQLKEILEA